MTLLSFSQILGSEGEIKRTQRSQNQPHCGARFTRLHFNDPFAAGAYGLRQLFLSEIQFRAPIPDQSA